MNEKISIIIPCYNEEAAVPIFYDTITPVLQALCKTNLSGYELIFVNDGSKDSTISVIKSLSEKDHHVKYVSFSRNFGKEGAMFAGLEHAKGDFVAIMDVDLQDPPDLLPEMVNILQTQDYDTVATRRVSRKGEPPIRSFFARCFYKLINRISKADIVDGARDYRLMKRDVVDAILSLREYNRFSKGIFGWVGFKTKWLEYENIERVAGETKWSFWKLFLYSLEGIVAFSTAPLAISAVLGLIFLLIAFVLIIVVIVKTLIWGDPVAGYPSLVCIMLFIGGVQLFGLAIIGQYLSKTYLETKNRPIYIVKESNTEK